MGEAEVYLTRDGAAKLQAELDLLRGEKREQLAARLRHAVSMGDLSENADYKMAKEDQAFLEGRIQEIEALFRRATIIDRQDGSEVVRVGSTVVVALDGDEQETYTLVGPMEADPRQGKISYQSPFGVALINRRIGQTAVAATPGGKIELKILEIR